ncbi:RHS repeat-associated core domain-containing protein [Alicyclobacillus cycloheptanicus]
MYYLNARYYSPTQMRFISQDPLGGSINEYTYADDSPVMETDPTGEFGAGVLGLTGLADLAGFDAIAGWVPVVGWAAVGVTAVWGGYEVYEHYHSAHRSPYPPARRKFYPSRKAAKEAAKRAGKGRNRFIIQVGNTGRITILMFPCLKVQPRRDQTHTIIITIPGRQGAAGELE